MRKKKLSKVLFSFLTAALMSVSCLQGTLSAFAATTKNTEYKISDWGYNFSGSGLPNAYDPLTQKNSNNQFNPFHFTFPSKNPPSFCQIILDSTFLI